MAEYTYTGDMNPEYGGTWIDLSSWDDGYCTAVRVTDLDGGCGFRGACLIEHVVILGTDDPERIRQAMHSCGCGAGYHRRPAGVDPQEYKRGLRLAIADALMSYGYTDPDDYWDGLHGSHSEVVQLEADGPMAFDGWKADKRLRGSDLGGYVKAVHLK